MPRTSLILSIFLAVAGPTISVAAEQAAWGRLDAQATGRAVAGPAGWLNWCMADPRRCAPGAPTPPVPATPRLLALLETVQTGINGALTPRAEAPGRDLWQVGVGSGDCEDYALAKQERLRMAGMPSGALRLATARLPHGELHAVLTVETDRGTLVLDNLQRHVVPLAALRYAWLRAQGSDGTLRWRELAAGPAAGNGRTSLAMAEHDLGAVATAEVPQ